MKSRKYFHDFLYPFQRFWRDSPHCAVVDRTLLLDERKAGFGYDNSVSLQTDDAGHMGAAVLANVVCVVGLHTNDVRRN